jgi:GT2 family glycosyltransferase
VDNCVVSLPQITAIVTAYQRIDQTLATLEKVRACQPRPAEILVHVDGNQLQCEAAVRQAFPSVKILSSGSCVGPGGGRNKLVAAAKNEFIASFDDDSYPIDADYFARVHELFETYPGASILCAAVFHQGELVAPASRAAEWGAEFQGCACVYHRSAFLAASGYLPLPVAYGMEEVDLALRIHAQGGRILRTGWLRVFHDTRLAHHANPEVTAGSIANQVLLAYLRYPPLLWPVGLAQVVNRVVWLIKNGRRRGILRGLAMVPMHVARNRRYRQTVSCEAVRSYLRLRRNPVPTTF